MRMTGDELLDRMAVYLCRLYADRNAFIREAEWQKLFADYDERAAKSDPPAADRLAQTVTDADGKTWVLAPVGTSWDMRNEGRELLIDHDCKSDRLDELADTIYRAMLNARPPLGARESAPASQAIVTDYDRTYAVLRGWLDPESAMNAARALEAALTRAEKEEGK